LDFGEGRGRRKWRGKRKGRKVEGERKEKGGEEKRRRQREGEGEMRERKGKGGGKRKGGVLCSCDWSLGKTHLLSITVATPPHIAYVNDYFAADEHY